MEIIAISSNVLGGKTYDFRETIRTFIAHALDGEAKAARYPLLDKLDRKRNKLAQVSAARDAAQARVGELSGNLVEVTNERDSMQDDLINDQYLRAEKELALTELAEDLHRANESRYQMRIERDNIQNECDSIQKERDSTQDDLICEQYQRAEREFESAQLKEEKQKVDEALAKLKEYKLRKNQKKRLSKQRNKERKKQEEK